MPHFGKTLYIYRYAQLMENILKLQGYDLEQIEDMVRETPWIDTYDYANFLYQQHSQNLPDGVTTYYEWEDLNFNKELCYERV